MNITFIGATHEVTGSCSLLEVAGKKILIDRGMEQGENIYENVPLPCAAGEIDAVCLTHAHIDHSGMIPALAAAGFKGPVYCTLATHKLCEIMLRDSAHIQEFEADWRNRKAKRSGAQEYIPVYTMADAEQVLTQFVSCGYNEEVELFDGITARFIDAGHLLGSSSIYLTLTEGTETRTVIFSGDLGNVNRPLIRDPQMPDNADYVIIESTYGDRLHGERPDYVSQLTSIIQDTFDRGGNVVVPSFAVGRTQELLYLIRNIKENDLIKGHDNFPVYVDSPLAVEATNIYGSGLTDYYDEETLELLGKGIDPIHFKGLMLSVTSDDSKRINFDKTPKIILSASGMCEAGRIRHHLKHTLWRSDSTVLFVGYQAEGTIGRKLIDGASMVKLFGEEIAVHAAVCQLDGISGHADRDMLLGWLGSMDKAPVKVFVNHGEDSVCDGFAKTIESELGFTAVAPFSGDSYDLLSGECAYQAQIVRIADKTDGKKRAGNVFNRLLDAGKRMLLVIDKLKGHSNKELAKLTDQINSLCDKYEEK